jgi:hypothetical protein
VTTPPGSLFPTVTRRGVLEWWVIPEGLTGQAFSLVTGKFTKYTTIQSPTKPKNSVAGPFPTQATAQAAASNMTAQAIPGPATPGAAVQDVTNGIFTQSSFWLRAGEVLAGLVLFYVGAKSLFPQQVSSIVQPAKALTGRVGTAAKMGLI